MRKSFLPILVALLAVTASAQRTSLSTPPSGQAHLGTVAMIDLPGRPGFDSVAIANGLVVTSHTGANTVDIFDPQKRRLVAQISNIAMPRGIAVDAKNNRFFVATANSVISVVSSQDWQVKDTFNVEGSPDVLALSADGLRLYVGDKTASTVLAVDTGLRKTIAKAQLSGRPESMASDGTSLYVSVQDAASIAVLDAQLNVSKQFKLQASQPAALALDAANKRIYVAVRAAVLAVNAEDGTEVARVPAARGVSSLYFDAPSKLLFAAGGGSVLLLDTRAGLTSVDELLADVKGHAFVYDPTRKMIFMPGGREGRSKMLIVRDLTPGGAPASSSEAALH